MSQYTKVHLVIEANITPAYGTCCAHLASNMATSGEEVINKNAIDLASRTPQGGTIQTDSSRPNNLQRIAQKKQQVRSFPRSKKLEKLAVYSSCKVCVLFGTDPARS